MGKSLPTCSVCGHSSHGKSRCTVFESEVSEEDIPDLGLCVFMDSHPCNCEGMPNAVAEGQFIIRELKRKLDSLNLEY